jgi:biopolymer transport protein ExbD
MRNSAMRNSNLHKAKKSAITTFIEVVLALIIFIILLVSLMYYFGSDEDY